MRNELVELLLPHEILEMEQEIEAFLIRDA